MSEPQFIECEPCGAKPGSPYLCASCLHNRDLIERLKKPTLPLVDDFCREHSEEDRWTPFDRGEYRVMQLFATWLDARVRRG